MLARLERALETERAFAADASHELRTPLAILRGELEVALRRERSPEELRATIAAALDEAVRLSRLADDLLVMARADAGHLELQLEPLDAAGLLETVRDRFAGRAAESGRAVEVEARRSGRAARRPRAARAGDRQPRRQRAAPRRAGRSR